MSNPISNLIEKYAISLEIPMPNEVTPEAQRLYKTGIDKANEYRGNPIILREALDLIQRTNCLPLFSAGVAYIHFVGSYIRGIEYDKFGLALAEKWIRKVEALSYTGRETSSVKAFINIHRHDFDQAEQNLDSLSKFHPLDFHSLMAFLDYHALKNNKELFQETYQKILEMPLRNNQRAYILNRAGRYFLVLRMENSSLKTYQDLSKLTPNDPWMWHNMSTIYLAKKKIIRAWKCNKKALEIMDFGNARMAQSQIKGKLIREAIRIVVILLPFILLAIFSFN